MKIFRLYDLRCHTWVYRVPWNCCKYVVRNETHLQLLVNFDWTELDWNFWVVALKCGLFIKKKQALCISTVGLEINFFYLDSAEYFDSQVLLASYDDKNEHKAGVFQHSNPTTILYKRWQIFICLTLGENHLYTNKVACRIRLSLWSCGYLWNAYFVTWNFLLCQRTRRNFWSWHINRNWHIFLILMPSFNFNRIYYYH